MIEHRTWRGVYLVVGVSMNDFMRAWAAYLPRNLEKSFRCV